MTSKTLKAQVGGGHYKGGSIQPIEFFMSNTQLDFCEQNMIKYAYRHKSKNGLEDLLKVVHYAMLEAKFHYGEEDKFFNMVRGVMGDDTLVTKTPEIKPGDLDMDGVKVPNIEQLVEMYDKLKHTGKKPQPTTPFTTSPFDINPWVTTTSPSLVMNYN